MRADFSSIFLFLAIGILLLHQYILKFLYYIIDTVLKMNLVSSSIFKPQCAI